MRKRILSLCSVWAKTWSGKLELVGKHLHPVASYYGTGLEAYHEAGFCLAPVADGHSAVRLVDIVIDWRYEPLKGLLVG